MAPLRGFDAKIRVNGAVYVAQEYEVDQEQPSENTSNTEGQAASESSRDAVGSEAHVPGLYRARVRIRNASYDTRENYFLDPVSLDTGVYAEVQIFKNGLDDISWHFPSILIESINDHGTVPGLQPLTFSGITDGDFFTPGEEG